MVIKKLESLNSLNEQIERSNKCLIKFSTNWCKKCKVLDKQISQHRPKYDIYEVDLENTDFMHLNIKKLPCVWFIKKGEKVEFFPNSYDDIESKIKLLS
jgi:thioredoxin-like negative regulator of GroEL